MVTTLPSAAGTGGTEADSSDASSLELEELEEALPPSPVATNFLQLTERSTNKMMPLFFGIHEMFHARCDLSFFLEGYNFWGGWVSLLKF